MEPCVMGENAQRYDHPAVRCKLQISSRDNYVTARFIVSDKKKDMKNKMLIRDLYKVCVI